MKLKLTALSVEIKISYYADENLDYKMEKMTIPRIKNFSKILKLSGLILGSLLLYYFTFYLGLQFAVAVLNKPIGPIWPTSGFAISLIFIFGYEIAAGIFLAAFLANFYLGLTWLPSLLMAAGNTGEALMGVWVYHFLIKHKNDYGVHTKIIFAIFSMILAAGFGASIGTAILFNFDLVQDQAIFKNWATWWICDLVGALFLIPFAYKISIAGFTPFRSISKKYYKLLILILLSVGLNYFVFFMKGGAGFLFIVFLPLLLAAIWFDSLWIYIISFLTCLGAITFTVHGHGPFAQYILNENLIHLQLFLLGLGVTALGLGSLRQEGLHQRAVTALVFGWILSGLTFYSFFNSNKEAEQSRFVLQAEQAQKAIESKFNDYIALLDSCASFFKASKHVSQQEWKIFTEKLMTNKNFSSVEALGVAFPSASTDLNQFKQANNIHEVMQGFKFFSVPHAEDSKKNLSPQIHFVITYIEPFSRKKDLVGLDLSTEKNRLEAALQARDTGLPSASNSIHLTQDKNVRAAFMLFSPLYRQNYPLATVKQRQQAFLGFVFAPIIVEKFIQNAFQEYANQIHLTLSFDADSAAKNTIFSSKEKAVDLENVIIKKDKWAGQPVTYTFRKTNKFESSSSLIFSLMGFFGALISLLLAVILSSLQNLTITAQALAENKTKEIVEKNQIWKSLTETSPVGIYLTDKDGNCTYVNPAWSQMTGLSLEEVQGNGWICCIHPDDVSLVLKNWNELLSGKKFVSSYRFCPPNKNIVHILGQAVPLINEKNEVTGYLGITQDVTDSIKKNYAMIASSRLSSLGEMASGIAHEINNPLSIILGKTVLLESLLKSDQLDYVKAKKHILQMTETIYRIAKIIKGLRSFARDTTAEPFEKCSFLEVVEDTLELCRERFYSHGIRLILPETIDPELYFLGRSEQLAQVLLNLLNNAFDAASESNEKWIEIKVKAQYQKVQISISDSGAGINPTMIEKIFEPFYTSKDIGKGTGLGLSISKGIMESHHGVLYLDRIARHTTFVIEIAQHLSQNTMQMDFIE